jgi:hypothetical protein
MEHRHTIHTSVVLIVAVAFTLLHMAAIVSGKPSPWHLEV